MRYLGIAVLLLALAGCKDDGHGHEHDDHAHDGHDDHAHDAQDEHDDHGHEHGSERVGWTDFTDVTQLFAEYPPLHQAEEATFRLHLTTVRGWHAVSKHGVTLTLTIEGQTQQKKARELAPGIFEVKLTPTTKGIGTLAVAVGDSVHTRKASVSQPGDHDAVHDGHDEHGHDHKDSENISFTLEQQWAINFGLKPILSQTVRPTFNAFGSLQPRLGGEGVVHAQAAGRISGEEIPSLGDHVKAGQTLAWLTPSIAEQGDFASLDLAVRQANTRLRAAKVKRDRLAGLVKQGVVPERRLTEATFELEEAESNLSAAKSRNSQAKGVSGTGQRPKGSVAIRAPIDGVIVGVDVPPGLIVESNRALFRIIDPDPIWLRVEVPEVHISKLKSVTGVWFEVQGVDQPIELYDVPVSVGGMVDKTSRTLPVIVEVPNPDGALRPGMFADAHVVKGEAVQAVVVPEEAIVLEEGVPVAYAMVDAETFERRTLTLGERAAGVVVVKRGLEAGEWVVTDGAFAVRLAALGDVSGAGHHGHDH